MTLSRHARDSVQAACSFGVHMVVQGWLWAARSGEGSLKAAVAAYLAFAYLNPLVYLDTVLLSGRFIGRGWLACGVNAAAPRLLQLFFARPSASRILCSVVGLVMAGIAVNLTARRFAQA